VKFPVFFGVNVIPQDKFGNPIYRGTFSRLCTIGRRLERLGYQESKKKPNLFYKGLKGVRVYADMRGTEEVPIWEEPRPLFYIFFSDWSSEGEKAVITEWDTLRQRGCNPRLSFEGIMMRDPEDINSLDQCGFCGRLYFTRKGFDGIGGFCSEQCFLFHFTVGDIRDAIDGPIEQVRKKKCAVCGKHPRLKIRQHPLGPSSVWEQRFDRHHVNYETDETVLVCKQCHGKITRRQKGLERFFPIGEPSGTSNKPKKGGLK